MDIIKGTPTKGLTYDPNDPVYWDERALQEEMERVFEICHGCRLCFNLCPSFPELLNAIDRNDGDVRALSTADRERVNDTCYQCKLCYVKCPYTPDDKHEFQLDFPRLLIRANAVRRKRTGIDLRSKLLSRPDTLGRAVKPAARLANWMNRHKLMRGALEDTLGIHRDKLLPEFHSETFEDWLRKQGKTPGDPGKAVLFTTCFVNFNNPQIGRDTLKVFSKNGVSLGCPKQNCCGMPALEAGDVDLAKKLAQANVESLAPQARAGKKILAVNPTCSYMLRKEYKDLVPGEDARQVACATMDLCEYLFEMKKQGQFNRDFKSTPGKVGYHLPCHLKAQNIGYRSRDMMRLIPRAEVKLIDQCCGHDGTWAMKKEFFPLSMLTGKKAFNEMTEASAGILATDCPLAAVQFEQAIGRRPIHPIQVLARAYEPEGFPNPIEEK